MLINGTFELQKGRLMVRFGRSIRWKNDYYTELEFSKKAGFDFHQIWYSPTEGISILGLNIIDSKNLEFDSIIHALMDIEEINEENIVKLQKIIDSIESKELIIHPICRNKNKTNNSIKILSKISVLLILF